MKTGHVAADTSVSISALGCQRADLVRQSLQKILHSDPFARSPRVARFLRYLVEQSLSPNVSSDLALAFDFSREYDQVVEHCRKTMDFTPGFYRPHNLLGLAYRQKGLFAEAVRQFEQARALSRGRSKMSIHPALAYSKMGKNEKARRIGEELAAAQSSPLHTLDLALLYLAMGDRDHMFTWLEKALLEHESELFWLSADPIDDGVRRDPRSSSLLERMGHPQPRPGMFA
jgi:tetratricopeptide (TPR) repeat protein